MRKVYFNFGFKGLLSLLLVLGSLNQLNAQTYHRLDNVDFTTYHQNMWGPSWNPFVIDQHVPIFHLGWNESFNQGSFKNTWLFGKWGAGVEGHMIGHLGMEFVLEGFTTGHIDVEYPIQVDLEIPNDGVYDPGDEVTIKTDYSVRSGWALDTYYPNAGEARLDFLFRLAVGVQIKICTGFCWSIPIIPSFDTGNNVLSIFKLNQNGVDLFSLNGGTGFVHYAPDWPIMLSDFAPATDFITDWGIDAGLTLPYVETDAVLTGPNNHNIHAEGDSTYIFLEVALIQLIGNAIETFGGPIAPVGTAIQYLNQDINAGPIKIKWQIFDPVVSLNIKNTQKIDFTPKVYSLMQFPLPVSYRVNNPSGMTIQSGTSSMINVQLGNDLVFDFPCHHEELNIVPKYSIDGIIRNHTYDRLTLDFEITVFKIQFSFNASIFSFGFTIGPLWHYETELAELAAWDWFDQTWSLEGFGTYEKDPIKMIPFKPYVTNNVVDVSCYGGNDGAISVAPVQITPALPFNYVWTNGASSQNINNVEAGSYQVEIYDANGCQLFTGGVVQEPEQPVSINYTKIDKLCNGGLNDGQISTLVQGGTFPYTYSWDNGQTTEDINSLAPGTYNLTVTDAKGCVEQVAVEIGEPVVLSQAVAINNVDCKNNASGSILANVSGGTMPYSYSWSSGQTTKDIFDVPAGVYDLTVTDANGCQNVVSYTVAEPAQELQLVANVTDILCKGDLTGAIDITTSGGTAGYSFNWINAQGQVMPVNSEDITNVVAGTYTVSVTDEHGCKTSLTRTITEPALAVSTLPVITDVNCFGDTSGEINPGIFGGTPNYNYAWSTGSSNAILENVTAGNYSVTITDDNGCVEQFNYEIIEPEAAIDVVLEGHDVLCKGENTGAIVSIVNGGTAPYDYDWSNGGATQNLNQIPAGNYSLDLVDDLGCTFSISMVINEPDLLVVTPTVTPVDCYAANTGDISLQVVGGIAPYQYAWSDGFTQVITNTSNQLPNLIAGNYNLEVTDANGCKVIDLITVPQPAEPIKVTDVQIVDVDCFGEAHGDITINVSGGTPNYTYNWSNGSGDQDQIGVVAGTYHLTITDDNMCTWQNEFVINEPSAPLVATLVMDSVKCKDASTGNLYSTVTGGTLPYSYSWSNGASTSNLLNIPSNTYNLTVTDANGCMSFTGALVTEPDSLIVDVAIDDVLCYGGRDGKIEITITGGVQPYYYNWGEQNDILLNHFSEVIDGLTYGEYLIRVRDRNGCVNEQRVLVDQPAPIKVEETIFDVLCYGENSGYTLLSIEGGAPDYNVIWSDGQTTQDAVGLVAGNYSYTVIDDHLCIYSGEVTISQPDLIKAHTLITEVTCEDQADGIISTQGYGGVPPFQYSWDIGSQSSDIENLAPGVYVVTISDNQGCEQAFTYELLPSEFRCVEIPNTFTPNGDFYNDTWIIENMDLYPEAEVRVFNKWGNQVFESIGTYTPWDGTHNGRALPAEVYYYVVTLNNDESYKYTGTITIIR